MLKWMIFLFFILYILNFISAQTFETGDNSTVRGCSNSCTYDADSLRCWNTSLLFFEKILLGQMRNYVAIDQWERRNKKNYSEDFENAKKRSIKTMESLLHNDDILNKKTIETVVNALVNLAAQQSNHSMVLFS